MASLLGRFTKQSAETLDYDVDFSKWFADRQDTPAAFTVTTENGITVANSSISGQVVKVVLSGGTSGRKYKVTVRLSTNSGLVREADFQVTVKDV